jgi:hypothetical protein
VGQLLVGQLLYCSIAQIANRSPRSSQSCPCTQLAPIFTQWSIPRSRPVVRSTKRPAICPSSSA